jgi:hypothetical protein
VEIADGWFSSWCNDYGLDTEYSPRHHLFYVDLASDSGMHLVRKPKRPKWRPFVQINMGMPHHDSWKHFLDLAYWNVELGEDLQ